MSFFDEVDEPRTPPRSQPRPRRRTGSGGGGRRPPSQPPQSIQARRGIAAVALLVVVILIALGVHSCQVSSRNSALKDYTNGVSSIIQRSAKTGSNLFAVLLSSGTGASNAGSLQNQINQARVDADAELASAKSLSVPDEARTAQADVVRAMQMRVDGLTTIASEIQPALGTSTSKDAVNAIAGAMARFYASDVLYKLYAAPEIAAALHGAGIAVGGSGQAIAGNQFLPDVHWVLPNEIAKVLHVSLPGASGHHGKIAPGTHGHTLTSVTVNGTTLSPTSTNTLTANPAPTFTLNYTNGGTNNEFNVKCTVTVSGTNVSGSKTISETFAGQSGSCDVTLNSSPGAGTQTVVATIQPVPGETNTANNTLSFPVTFQ